MPLRSYVFTFDLYGTLCDPTHIGDLEKSHPALARAWRTHQLEISWLLTIMGRYENFDRVTAYALDVALAETRVDLDSSTKCKLLEGARRIPLYDDVVPSLRKLVEEGARLAVCSNGTPTTMTEILSRAGIFDYFTTIISADELKTFKPAASVYAYAAKRLGCDPGAIWYVSGNPFDCAAATVAGMRVVKLERTASYRYPFSPPTNLVIQSLSQLDGAVGA